jgi:hypothetical protein
VLQHVLTSTQAWPAGQDALVVQDGRGGVVQKASLSRQRTFPSALRPHSHVAPQLALGSMQMDVVAGGQVLVGKHEPSWQTWVAPQTALQVPQLVSSVLVFTQVPPQFVKPPGQQVPFWQLPLPPVGNGHGVPRGLGLHLPFLHVFFPLFDFRHGPFLHFSHAAHFGLHLRDVLVSASITWSTPTPRPARRAIAPRRVVREATIVARLSKRSPSMSRSSGVGERCLETQRSESCVVSNAAGGCATR